MTRETFDATQTVNGFKFKIGDKFCSCMGRIIEILGYDIIKSYDPKTKEDEFELVAVVDHYWIKHDKWPPSQRAYTVDLKQLVPTGKNGDWLKLNDRTEPIIRKYLAERRDNIYVQFDKVLRQQNISLITQLQFK